MSISSDEVNFLIFRYLSENGEEWVVWFIFSSCIYSTYYTHVKILIVVCQFTLFIVLFTKFRILSFCIHVCTRIAGCEIQHCTDRNTTRSTDHFPSKGAGIHCYWRAYQWGEMFCTLNVCNNILQPCSIFRCCLHGCLFVTTFENLVTGWIDPRLR